MIRPLFMLVCFALMGKSAMSQYNSCADAIKFINNNLSSYNDDGLIKSTTISIDNNGELNVKTTHTISGKISTTMEQVVNISELKEDVSFGMATDIEAYIIIRCVDEKESVLYSTTFARSGNTKTRYSKFIMLYVSKYVQSDKITKAFEYIIKNANTNPSFLEGSNTNTTSDTKYSDNDSKITVISCAKVGGASNIPIISNSEVSYDNQISSTFYKIKYEFGLNCKYFYYNDAESHNAFANPDDNNIYLGVGFIKDCFTSGNGITAVRVLIAHEMSHLYQFANSGSSLLEYDNQSHYGELQADFMAGYVLTKLGYVSRNNYKVATNSIWKIGDIAWTDSDHHGSPSERTVALFAGICNSNMGTEEAYSYSYDYLPPPNGDQIGNKVGIIFMNNGKRLTLLYGGKVCIIQNNQYVQVAQFTTNTDSFGFRINFSTDGWKDLIVDTQTQLVYTMTNTNYPVGKLEFTK